MSIHRLTQKDVEMARRAVQRLGLLPPKPMADMQKVRKVVGWVEPPDPSPEMVNYSVPSAEVPPLRVKALRRRAVSGFGHRHFLQGDQ